MEDDVAKAGGDTLEAGQIIKPYVTLSTVKGLISKIYGMNVNKVTEMNSYDDKNYHVKVDTDIDNPFVSRPCDDGYVFKILNSMDSQKPSYIEAQHALLRYLFEKGINCPQIIPNIRGDDFVIEKLFHEKDESETTPPRNTNQYGLYLIRMFNYISGSILNEIEVTNEICYQAGKYIGRIDKYLTEFHHRGLEGHKTVWSLESVPKLTDFSYAIRDPKRNKLVNDVIEKFTETVVPNYPTFKRGVIHGDFNEQNIVCSKTRDGDDKIYGVIDFGDVHISYYLFELALCITYMMLKVEDAELFSCGGHVLAGYLEEMDLLPEELNCLQLSICGRLSQSLAMGEYTYSLDPGNEYLLTSAKRGWHVLDKIWNIDRETLFNTWDEIIVDYQNKCSTDL